MLRQVRVGEGLHPAGELLLAGEGVPGAVEGVVEVAPHDDVVALFILLLHHAAQHLQLLRAHGAPLVVGGHVAVDEGQPALGALHRQVEHGEAAVQVGEFDEEALVHRVAAAHALFGGAAGEGEQPGVHRAVVVGEGIGEISAVEVLAPDGAVAGKNVQRHLPLVHKITAVRVVVHLLQQQQVGVQPFQRVQRGGGVGQHVLAAPGLAVKAPGGGAVGHHAGVHEEGVARPVGPEAQVAGDGGIFPARRKRLGGGAGHLQGKAVLDAVILQLQIGRIPGKKQRQRAENNGQRQGGAAKGFFHLDLFPDKKEQHKTGTVSCCSPSLEHCFLIIHENSGGGYAQKR